MTNDWAAGPTDISDLVATGNLQYDRFVEIQPYGMPLGNGRMGGLVWLHEGERDTSRIDLQLNHTDIFGFSSTSDVAKRHQDYCGACGKLAILFGGTPFPDSKTRQVLDLYQGQMRITGQDVELCAFASMDHDCLVIILDDRRSEPQDTCIELSMIRPQLVKTESHVAESWLELDENRMVLKQVFSEPSAYAPLGEDHYCASALVVSVDSPGATVSLVEPGTARIRVSRYTSHPSDVPVLECGGRGEGRAGDTAFPCAPESVPARRKSGVDVLHSQARFGLCHRTPNQQPRSSLTTPGENPFPVDVDDVEHSEIHVPGQPGRTVILIASAASMDPKDDVVAAACAQLGTAAETGVDALRSAQQAWWQAFWSKSYIVTPDQPEFAKRWVYYLYLSACTMRGKYPGKFNSQIWITEGDERRWGGRYWWWNQGTMHSSFFAANHIELNDPLFDMRSAAFPAYEKAALQDWRSKGIFIPETCTFNGPAELPEEIAAEIRKVFIDRQPPSERLRAICDRRQAHESRWSWNDNPDLPVGWVSHVMVAGPKTAELFWKRYEYTKDRNWLAERAYPMLKGAAEFYVHYPNLSTDEDGIIHINNTSVHEHFWGCRDCVDDLALMRGVLRTAAHAAALLNRDEDLQERWTEIADKIAPYPTNQTPGALGVLESDRVTLAQGVAPVALSRGYMGPESPRLRMAEQFDLLTLESDDDGLRQLLQNTFDALPGTAACQSGKLLNKTSRYPVIAARLGRSDAIAGVLPSWLQRWQGERETPNGLPVTGDGITVQGYGIFSDALQQALCQSIAPEPGAESVIRIFPAWPRDWDAQFKLLCKGGFLVSASMKEKCIGEVTVESQLGGTCRIRNPWFPEEVAMTKNGQAIAVSAESLIVFETEQGEHVCLGPVAGEEAEL
jgi:hypothetical protein